jgi:hypothetical protein
MAAGRLRMRGLGPKGRRLSLATVLVPGMFPT